MLIAYLRDVIQSAQAVELNSHRPTGCDKTLVASRRAVWIGHKPLSSSSPRTPTLTTKLSRLNAGHGNYAVLQSLSSVGRVSNNVVQPQTHDIPRYSHRLLFASRSALTPPYFSRPIISIRSSRTSWPENPQLTFFAIVLYTNIPLEAAEGATDWHGKRKGQGIVMWCGCGLRFSEIWNYCGRKETHWLQRRHWVSIHSLLDGTRQPRTVDSGMGQWGWLTFDRSSWTPGRSQKTYNKVTCVTEEIVRSFTRWLLLALPV